ncbi:MAG: 5-formyltetrahydrofolate cyclo-ligase [Myxococcales bacterium]|nr:5-formyltetrahydrofolate cyclo-ligase [Myxococcales bacterium]
MDTEVFEESAMREEKQRLRRAQRDRRNGHHREYWLRVGRAITGRVARFLLGRPRLMVGVYNALPDEPVIAPLPHATAFPRVEGREIHFHECHQDRLRPGAFGIEEPPIGAPIVHPDVILVPGLAFAEDGSRLGRGQGFYDRYLATHETLSIGVVDEAGLLASVPREAHDARMDVIVTQDRVLDRKDTGI